MTIHRVGSVYIADTARVQGEVTLGADANLWYGVAVRGDVAPVTIGARTNVQDNVTVHCDEAVPNQIGEDVTLAHGVIAHGVSVGDGALIGIAARLLAGSRVGRGAIVAAGAVVAEDFEVPDGMVAMGIPARVIRPVSEEERAYLAMIPPRYVRLARLHHEHPDDPRTRPYTG